MPSFKVIKFSLFKFSKLSPPCIFKALIVATKTAHEGLIPPTLHFISKNFSAPKSSADTESLQEIKSPIVGVFYEAKDPESEPFVKIGQKVKKGDVLCILESMKMMNEIRSDYDGIVKEIKCKNEELVEFGQVMFVLES